ncbi:aspartate-semialdehyde dehydrogenase [Mesonia sp. HuA40]|uniref:aspartate-semialdehyde dehydrogenase n=1 Tax=Mesonia sp. HuA40 TaxID=2602761 RepID=UPI0011C730A0|nr:aspartate-semialdehyde dehydrogenase [Mesonia sp. HuA40]TXK72660.1 aspartate-semialdehyde dehydrogenase [Mesonia sp. HuA40]
MRLAVVGATGMVGQVILEVLQERNFPLTELIPVASERSVGKSIVFKKKEYPIVGLQTALEKQPDIALFSAGGDTSLLWAPRFAEIGTRVIDNSSAWRMDATKKLIVPEINASQLTKEDFIIANPNCSTVQLVMVLSPLHQRFRVRRVIVSTYQSITGTGVKAVQQLENEMQSKNGEMAYPYPIHQNAIPHCDVFLENDYTKEEMKLTQETKKILQDENVLVSATAVRIPVVGGHSEAVNIEFEKTVSVGDIKAALQETPGVQLQDNPDVNAYPMPVYAQGKDEVFVGRIRADHSHSHAINMWIVADNLRKGAATNAVQIAEYLIAQNLV